MTDEEKKHEEGVEDLEIKDCPLSPTDWVMFLSGEIHHVEMKYFMFESTVIVAITIFVGMIAVAFALNPVYLFIFACFILFMLLILMSFRWTYIRKVTPALKNLKELRGKVITGKWTDSSKICKRWREIDIVFKKRKNSF